MNGASDFDLIHVMTAWRVCITMTAVNIDASGVTVATVIKENAMVSKQSVVRTD